MSTDAASRPLESGGGELGRVDGLAALRLPVPTSIPTAGLVLPAYNAQRFLAEAIAAIQGQTVADFICVVVDDGSTDGTAQMARDLTMWDGRFTVVSKSHGGVASARNYGLRHLPPTRYVSFPDGDDRLDPDALELLLARAEAGSYIGAHALARRIDEHGVVLASNQWWTDLARNRCVARHGRLHPIAADVPTSFNTLINACTMYPPALAITRRDIADAVGDFTTTCNVFEDWDWFIRCTRHGNYAFADRAVIDYRIHAGNLSKDPNSLHYYERVRIRTSRSDLNSPDQQRIVRAAWRAAELAHVRDNAKLCRIALMKGKLPAMGTSVAKMALAGARLVAAGPSRLDAA
jgi:glycosyltransferase involved in cell wall biosynthesis